MSYVSDNLLKDEEIVLFEKVHWFVYVPGLTLLVLGMYLFSFDAETGSPIFGAIAVVVALISTLNALVIKSTTELAITTKRVIAKVGFIKRETIELNHTMVESINVSQGIFGRMFDFGTLSINGSGGGKTPIKSICSPLKFRKAAMELVDKSQDIARK